MSSDDFRKYAKPWLDELTDDPNNFESLDQTNTTTFPAKEVDWEADQVKPIENDEPLDAHVQEEDALAARSARAASGLDVLAFYKSFRFIDLPPFRGKWGIFLLDAGIEGLAQDLIELTPSLLLSDAREFATEILLAHERYHFWIDTWALGQEITPLFSASVKRWEYYHAAKRSVELTPDDFEESLANHYVYKKLSGRKFANGQRAASTLRKILLDGPSPYSDFDFNATERTRLEGLLASAVANGQNPLTAKAFGALKYGLAPTVLSASIQPVDRTHPVVGMHLCSTYQVAATGYASTIAPFQGPTRKKFKLFMTNYLAGEEIAFTDHSYYRIDNGEKIKFPNAHDKEVRGYELKGTLLKAGMTQQEFNLARQKTDDWKNNCPRSPVKSPLGRD